MTTAPTGSSAAPETEPPVGGERCTCPDEEHTCPYQVEINDNSEYVCSCCPDCTQECANDI